MRKTVKMTELTVTTFARQGLKIRWLNTIRRVRKEKKSPTPWKRLKSCNRHHSRFKPGYERRIEKDCLQYVFWQPKLNVLIVFSVFLAFIYDYLRYWSQYQIWRKQIWIARTYVLPFQEAVEGRHFFPLKFRENRGCRMSSGYTLKHVYRSFDCMMGISD